jgi:hypothetical protein
MNTGDGTGGSVSYDNYREGLYNAFNYENGTNGG